MLVYIKPPSLRHSQIALGPVFVTTCKGGFLWGAAAYMYIYIYTYTRMHIWTYR